jgi:hypothetical protein
MIQTPALRTRASFIDPSRDQGDMLSHKIPEKTWRKPGASVRQATRGNHKKKKHIQAACLKGQIPRPKLKSYL